MQFVAPLFLKLVGGAATAAGAAAPVASTGLGALQLASGVLGAVATIGSGIAAEKNAKAEAAQHEFAAKDEYIAGKETSAALKSELARTIANQKVAFAAGGVDLGSVSVEAAQRQVTADAERELSITSGEAVSRSLQRRRAAANARARGRSAKFSSFVGAGQQLIGTGINMAERG